MFPKFKSLADVEMINLKGKPNSILGVGGFSKVRLVHHRKDPNFKCAMKALYKKNKTEVLYIKKELELHKDLDHPNIVKFYDYFETTTHFYFFLELAKYGDLFDYVRSHKPSLSTLIRFFQ